MELFIDILLDSHEIAKTDLIEIKKSWGNEMFSTVPPTYMYNGKKCFHQSDSKLYKQYIPEDIDWIMLTCEFDLVRDLEWTVNKFPDKVKENIIINFISHLCEKTNNFAIAVLQADEAIEKIITFQSYSDFFPDFIKFLNWNTFKSVFFFRK